MCLYVEMAKTTAWRKANLHKKRVTVYKAVYKGPYKKKATRVRSPCYFMEWKPGLVDSGASMPTEVHEGQVINRAIHVFTDPEVAVKHWGGVPLTVTVDPKDLMGVGSKGDLAFTKVRVTKKAIQKAIATRASHRY